MDTSKLKPNDPRVKSCYDMIRGKKYHYIVGEPLGAKRETMMLIHGFPDMGFGWRYQVPYLMSLGFQVIVPDMVGYARTEAPANTTNYTTKEVAADIKELTAKFVGRGGQIVLGGHDWGGLVAWRTAERYPELVKLVFTVCTPYIKASKTYTPLEDLVAAGTLKNFAYQLQFGGPQVEARIQGRHQIRQLLNGLYGGVGPANEVAFRAESGILFENLDCLKQTPLVSAEELDFYADEYMRQPAPQLRGPLNWYRTRKLSYETDLELSATTETARKEISIASLFITALKDQALPPVMSEGMEEHFDDLTRAEVDGGHWALWQAAEDVNRIVGEWLNEKLPTKASL